MLGGTSLAFFALVGFEDSVNMAEEVHEPHRTFPKALLGGPGRSPAAIYILVALTVLVLVDAKTLEKSSGPLLEVVKAGGVDFPPKLFALIALFAVTNTALINMLMASRLVYGMSRERIVPGVFGRVHEGRRTPWVAIIFTTVLGFALVTTAKVEDLGDTTALLLLCVFAVVNVAVLVLRRDPVDHDHFRVPRWCRSWVRSVCGAGEPAHRPGGQGLPDRSHPDGLGVVLWFVNRAVVGSPGQVGADRQGVR